MLEEARIVVVLLQLYLVRENECNIELDLVFGLILAVLALALCGPVLDSCERIIADDLAHVVGDPVFVEEFGLAESACFIFRAEHKQDIRVYHSLTLENIEEEFVGNIYISEYVEVRAPACLCTCLPALGRLLSETADVVALLEVKVISEPVTHDLNVHIFRGILRRAETESVQTEREFVALTARVIFAAGVELAVHELPVIALLRTVVVDGTAASEVLDLDVVVSVMGDDYLVSVACSCLIYRV